MTPTSLEQSLADLADTIVAARKEAECTDDRDSLATLLSMFRTDFRRLLACIDDATDLLWEEECIKDPQYAFARSLRDEGMKLLSDLQDIGTSRIPRVERRDAPERRRAVRKIPVMQFHNGREFERRLCDAINLLRNNGHMSNAVRREDTAKLLGILLSPSDTELERFAEESNGWNAYSDDILAVWKDLRKQALHVAENCESDAWLAFADDAAGALIGLSELSAQRVRERNQAMQ